MTMILALQPKLSSSLYLLLIIFIRAAAVGANDAGSMDPRFGEELDMSVMGQPSSASSHGRYPPSPVEFSTQAALQHLSDRMMSTTDRDFFPRRLQSWSIPYVPDPDPALVCDAFATNSGGNYTCDCSSRPDKTVYLSCNQTTMDCNDDDSICYQTQTNIGLNKDNVVADVETCTHYVHTNLTRFATSSTVVANFSYTSPCVLVRPVEAGNFFQLDSCQVTLDDQTCRKCEICKDDQQNNILAISFDCCNVRPDQQLKVTCGPVGGNGAMVPFFDTYTRGQHICSAGHTTTQAGAMVVMAMWMAAAWW